MDTLSGWENPFSGDRRGSVRKQFGFSAAESIYFSVAEKPDSFYTELKFLIFNWFYNLDLFWYGNLYKNRFFPYSNLEICLICKIKCEDWTFFRSSLRIVVAWMPICFCFIVFMLIYVHVLKIACSGHSHCKTVQRFERILDAHILPFFDLCSI